MKTTRIQKLKANDWEYQEDASCAPREHWKGGIKGDGHRTALVSCGGCGGLLSLSNHTIDDKGIVLPSVLCNCGWHVMMKLNEWLSKEE